MSTRPLILVLPVLLLAACSTPRKACERARRDVARAVVRCPDALVARVDTVYLPGDTIQDTTVWAQVELDSLMAACDSLRRAAETIALHSLQQQERVADALRRQQAVNAAVAGVRRQACRVSPLMVMEDEYDLVVRQLPDGRLVHSIHLHPKKEPCPPCAAVKNGPVQMETHGVDPWWRVAAIMSTLLLLVCLMALRHMHLAPQAPDQ
ncbi:MAG: hypothetical protein JNL05_00475 [Flavobacteriales bacterium]|nr:hypothetical protein [Flavobacteriales bacterium]